MIGQVNVFIMTLCIWKIYLKDMTIVNAMSIYLMYTHFTCFLFIQLGYKLRWSFAFSTHDGICRLI